VVAETNAVVNPRAVVIHLEDAGATNATVMAPIRLVLATPFAIPTLTRPLLLLKVELGFFLRIVLVRTKILGRVIPKRIIWYFARVDHYATDIADEQEKCHIVEDRQLNEGPLLHRLVTKSRSEFVLEHGHTMMEHIDAIKRRNDAYHKQNREKLRWLAKAWASLVGRRVDTFHRSRYCHNCDFRGNWSQQGSLALFSCTWYSA